MKKLIICFIAIFTLIHGSSGTPKYPELPVKDTVIINFGNNAKVMVLVDNPEDLKRISEFDINSMLQDLSLSVDTMRRDEQYLKIEDESGERYLKDTSIVLNQKQEIDLEALKEEIKAEMREELMQEASYKDREPAKKKRRNRGTNHYFNIELGMNNYMQDGKFPDENNELYSVKPWGSWYVGLTGTNRTHVAGPLYLDWGGGISWYNFKHQNFSTRLEKGDEGVIYFEGLDVPDPQKSKLALTHLNVNFVPVLNFGRSGGKKDVFHWDYHDGGFRIGAGGYAGYRVDSWAKYVWKEDGDKKKDRDKNNYYLNNFRYGVRFVMGYRSVDLFVNYDISELYATGRGPVLNPFSFGIIL